MELIEYKGMRESIQRIRELHREVKITDDYSACSTCITDLETGLEVWYVAEQYPCATIKALEGNDD